MPKFRIEKTIAEEVHVEEDAFLSSVIYRLKKMIHPKCRGWLYIKDGILYDEYEAYTSHSYTTEDKVREATDRDKAFLTVIHELNAKIREN